MAIQCPYCQYPMELKGGKPGKYAPRCQRCGQKFSLRIPDDPSVLPVVSELHDASEQTIAPAVAAALGLEIKGHAAAAGGAGMTMPPPATIAPGRGRDAGTSNIEHRISNIEQSDVKNSEPQPALRNPKSEIQNPKSPTLNERLGGYQILHKLGQGGMGAVFLARQLSLDRNVALKVLEPTLAADPQFVARFTREAYAAAQLTHHNVVQIHDIGAEERKHFFSMEFVEGRTLADLVRSEGKLAPDVAAGYILQAARGLKHAHDHGMIHRDIKPENLLLSADGIVKVADLGLVKTRGAEKSSVEQGGGQDAQTALPTEARPDVTQAKIVMGTPAYMAPEQASDAAKVDLRADIYSLGCTFYDLLTGHPPFEGRTVAEVMNKQMHEALVPPQQVVRNLPERLNAILMKMAAKRPKDRYANLGEVIHDLEDYLRIDSTAPFAPREEHVRALEIAAIDFHSSSAARTRMGLITVFFAVGAAAMIWAYATGAMIVGGTILGAMVLTAASHFVISGAMERKYVFRRVREWMFSASLRDWASAGIGLAIFVAILYVMGLHWVWLGVLVASIVLAGLFHLVVDRLVVAQRRDNVGRVQEMLRSMRLRGLEENTLRQFVCRYSGRHWEEFFESLFGYEAKIQARLRWGADERGQARPHFGGWRDAVISRIDRRMDERRIEREQRHLQAVEARGLEAAGVPLMDARKQARKRAHNLVHKAAALRQTRMRSAETLPPSEKGRKSAAAIPMGSEALAKSMFDADSEAPTDRGRHEGYISRRYGGPVALITGQAMRGAMAILLLAGFLLWQSQNSWPGVLETYQGIRDRQQEEATDRLKASKEPVKREPRTVRREVKRLHLAFVPDSITWIASSLNFGLAGVMLLLSLYWRGRLFGFAIILAALFTVLGPAYASHMQDLSLPDRMARAVPSDKQQLSMLVGLATWAFAMVFLRPSEG